MANKPIAIGVALACFIGVADARTSYMSASGICKNQITVQQRCQWVTGIIEIYNGTPAVRLTEKSTKKRYAVGPSEEELMPYLLKEKLNPDTGVVGEFKVCHMKQAIPHGLRDVCIDEVRKIK